MPLPLMPHQEDAARFLAQRIRAGLFDDMGVGKTAEMIRALDLRGALRGIVICPAVVRENWRGEFIKFATTYRRVVKGTSVHDLIAWQRERFDVLLVSYEMAAKWAKQIREACEPIDFVILDEAHYLKDRETSRAKAILGATADGIGGITQWAVASYWATGTPIPNDPMDIYTFLRFAGVMPLSPKAFTDRYFHRRERTYSAAHTPRAEALPELQKLIENNSIRRRLDDVGVSLPPIWITTTLVDGDTQAVRDLLRQYPGLDQAILDALEKGSSIAKLDADHVATLRRLIGEAKAIPYAQSLLWELKNGLDKMVVFGISRNALMQTRDYLVRNGVTALLINGDTPERERVSIVERFQSDPSARVFLGNIRAAGTGLTLTAANRIDMLESDWTPAGNAQALKRVHRLTQGRSVHARFITLAGSFDEIVNTIVAEKAAVIAGVEGVAMVGQVTDV